MNAGLFGPPGPDMWIRIRGRTVGAIVCFSFGTYSLYWWIVALRARRTWFYTIISIAAVLVACCIAQLVAMLRAPRSAQPHGSRKAIIVLNACFILTVALEVAGIILGRPILAHFHKSDFYSNWVGAVVGLHFLPLGKLFKMPIYYVTGAAITLAAVGSLLISPDSLRTAVCSGGAGVALWLTGGLILHENLSNLLPKTVPAEMCQPRQTVP